jgi:general secretion pathway protein K
LQRLTGDDRGVALVAVLWFTAAIAAMAAAFGSLARGEAMRSRNMVEAIRARTVLEAGLERAALELVTPTVRPSTGGVTLDWPFAGAIVHIAIAGESGRLDLNAAGPELIQALAKELGADDELAPRIADAIVDWRDENALRRPKGAEDREYRAADRPGGAADAPFGHVGELRQLLPIEPQMYQRLRELVTVATGRGEPESEMAPIPVRRAMLGADALEDEEGERGGSLLERSGDADERLGEAADDDPSLQEESGAEDDLIERERDPDAPPQSAGLVDPAALYSVRLDAQLASGYRAHADAVIWAQEAPDGRPYRVLDWDPSPWRPELSAEPPAEGRH